jgi:hypothetical protein
MYLINFQIEELEGVNHRLRFEKDAALSLQGVELPEEAIVMLVKLFVYPFQLSANFSNSGG